MPSFIMVHERLVFCYPGYREEVLLRPQDVTLGAPSGTRGIYPENAPVLFVGRILPTAPQQVHLLP